MTITNRISLLMVFLLAATAVNAADGTWTANSDGNWSDTSKWSGGTVADGTGFTAYLSNVINANRTITVDLPRTIGSIHAEDTSNNYIISGANALTLDVSSGVSVLDVVSGRSLTINTPVTVNDGLEKTGAGALTFGGPITLGAAQAWTNNSTGELKTGNGVNLIDNNGFDLAVDGSGTTTFGVVNNAAVTLQGAGNLIKNGTGRLNVGGTNTSFTGTVTINGGVLQQHNNSACLGAGNVTLNGGVLSFYWGVTYTRTLGTGNDQVQIPGGESGFAGAGSSGPVVNLGGTVVWGASGEGAATGYFNPGKLVLGDEGTGNAAATTFSSGIDLNGATRTIMVPAGNNAGLNRTTVSAAISNSSGTAGLIKEGGGQLIPSVAPTYNGTTTISEGLVDFAALNLNSMGGGAGVRDISVDSGAMVKRNAIDNTFLNRLVEGTNEITVISGATANNLDFSSSTGANLPNAFFGSWAGNGAKMEYSGTITPASNNYRLGSVYKSGVMGILNTSPMTGTQGLIIDGYVELVGPKTFTGDTVVRANARLGLASIAGEGGVSYCLQNSVLDVGASGGTIWLEATGAGSMSGAAPTTGAVFGGFTGSRNLSSVITTADGGNNVYATALTDITNFTLNVSAGTNITYSGAIGGFGAGASGSTGGGLTLTKTGLGTQVLSGANTYTGRTTVAAGTLGLDGANNIFPDVTAVLWVAVDAKLDIAAGVNETVYRLYLNDGQAAAVGTWGSRASSAEFRDDEFFSGTGIINVTDTDTGATAYVIPPVGTVFTFK